MRIALCLSGQPRTWRHTRPAMVDFFAGHEVDLFLHTWDEIDEAERRDLQAAYAPLAFAIEARPLFLSEKRQMAERFPTAPPFTAFDMFHSMAASVDMALAAHEAGRRYDLVCRSRFDLMHDGRWSGERPAANALHVPLSGDREARACNDQLAIGEPAAMGAYAGVSCWLADGLSHFEGPIFRPEVALRYYLTEVCGLTVARQPLAAVLMRPNQTERAFADLRDDPMVHGLKREEWEDFATRHGLRGGDQDLDFRHCGRMPLAFDRWLEALPHERRRAVLTTPWPERLVEIDRLLGDELGRTPMDAQRYNVMRLLCAALVNRMARDADLSPPSFIVHALSANGFDMQRSRDWVQADAGRAEQAVAAIAGLTMLEQAVQFAPPFDQPAVPGWRTD